MTNYIIIFFVVLFVGAWIWWGVKQLTKNIRKQNKELDLAALAKPDPHEAERSREIGIKVLTYIVGYIIVNVVLFVSQELYHWSDVSKCKDLERDIEVMEGVIENYQYTGTEEYQQIVKKYNASITDYNNLASHAYARWWLFPIPLHLHR
jgi:hypothetical protein